MNIFPKQELIVIRKALHELLSDDLRKISRQRSSKSITSQKGKNMEEQPVKREAFKKELSSLLHKHSIKRDCGVPAFLLSEMICAFLDGLSPHLERMADWHCAAVCHSMEDVNEETGERKVGA